MRINKVILQQHDALNKITRGDAFTVRLQVEDEAGEAAIYDATWTLYKDTAQDVVEASGAFTAGAAQIGAQVTERLLGVYLLRLAVQFADGDIQNENYQLTVHA